MGYFKLEIISGYQEGALDVKHDPLDLLNSVHVGHATRE